MVTDYVVGAGVILEQSWHRDCCIACLWKFSSSTKPKEIESYFTKSAKVCKLFAAFRFSL